MNRIASPTDLQHELRALLVYARTESPSRIVIASTLRNLADRVAKKKQTDAEYQSSDEYKTSKDPDYYPKKAPAGMKYPKEMSRLGPLKAIVMSMFEEDVDKDRAYRHKDVKKLQKSLAPRFETDEGWEEVRK